MDSAIPLLGKRKVSGHVGSLHRKGKGKGVMQGLSYDFGVPNGPEHTDRVRGYAASMVNKAPDEAASGGGGPVPDLRWLRDPSQHQKMFD